MRHFAIILTIIFSLAVNTVQAQYASVNVDYKTMEAMSEAFTTEAAMEALHNENLQKIYDSYKAAEIASAGIFSSKYLDRKALTNLNLWDDKKENYYYNRIYNIVSKRIIPKTITCAQLMVEDPSTAIYWGSYLLKTTEDVKSLCQQFESVVTNSTLSFKDIAFLQIAEELKAVFNITQLGGIDWKNLFEHLGDDIENSISGTLSFRGYLKKENIYQQKTDKNGHPFIVFSAYSLEKNGQEYLSTWVNFMRFPEKGATVESIIPDWMHSKAHVDITGELQVSAYNDVVRLSCRVHDMTEYSNTQQ